MAKTAIATPVQKTGLESMTRAQLVKVANQKEIPVSSSDKKDDIIKKLNSKKRPVTKGKTEEGTAFEGEY